MQVSPFNTPGRFYRGNLHTHSTLSDGLLSPEAVCAYYRANGYDFVSLTDHFLAQFNYVIADTTPYRTDDFTTIIGAELHAGRTEFGDMWHILANGLPLDFAPPMPDETGPQLAQRALAVGAFVSVAHPNWYALTENDVLSLGDVHAIEVINGTSLDHSDKVDSWYMLDLMVGRGKRYTACATDDAHFTKERDDTLLGWVWVKSEKLDEASLVESLKAGEYYSSTGPQIHDIEVHPQDKVIVRCSSAERVFVTGERAFARSVSGNGLREAEISIKGARTDHIRVTVRDIRGGRAWSNPIWLDS